MIASITGIAVSSRQKKPRNAESASQDCTPGPMKPRQSPPRNINARLEMMVLVTVTTPEDTSQLTARKPPPKLKMHRIIRYCAGCMENYVGQNFSAIVGFATSCTQTLAKTCPITNCKNCGQKSWGVDSCFVPKNGFVNSSDQLTTIATTLDKCWVYDTAGNCMMCWWPYWFSGSICAKSSLLKAVTGLVSFLALSYLM